MAIFLKCLFCLFLGYLWLLWWTDFELHDVWDLGMKYVYPTHPLTFVLYGVVLLYFILWGVVDSEVTRWLLCSEPKHIPRSDFSVCIIGAGFSGLGMAIKLEQLGVNYRILEKDRALGGTWWQNQYPGCGCDVDSHMYSFSFEQNPDWTTTFSSQKEILEYLNKVSEKYGVRKKIEFEKRVTSTVWSERDQQWTVTVDDGQVFTANVVVSCVGNLNVPRTPAFEGMDEYQGEAFHTAEWKSDFDPTGRTVAVIGTGASAVQIVPSIAEQVKHLYVFQRTPPWVASKSLGLYPRWLKWLFRNEAISMLCHRYAIYWKREIVFQVAFRFEKLRNVIKRFSLVPSIKKAVRDQTLAGKLTPQYGVGCKRITPSATYLQTFNRDNVTLVTEPIKRFNKVGIETLNGTRYAADTIVYAIGFNPAQSWHSVATYGREDGPGVRKGVPLHKQWGDEPNAYLGLAYPGYPNLFYLLGPGTSLGHHSVLFMIECQITYVLDAINKMVRRNITSIDVKEEVNDEYQKWAQACMKGKAFNSNTCSSWYHNSKGVNYTLYPNSCTQYWWQTRRADLSKYRCMYAR